MKSLPSFFFFFLFGDANIILNVLIAVSILTVHTLSPVIHLKTKHRNDKWVASDAFEDTKEKLLFTVDDLFLQWPPRPAAATPSSGARWPFTCDAEEEVEEEERGVFFPSHTVQYKSTTWSLTRVERTSRWSLQQKNT